MSILKILESIDADSKRSHKIAVIEQHKGNEEFKQVLTLALDPYVNFYIRKIPTYVKQQTGQSLTWALSELGKLSSRQLTGNAGVEHLRSVLSSISADDAVVIERIIGKDLRCGAGDGTVNAVIDKFIPSYPCLLARPYDAKNIKNIVYPAISQLKADGLRVNIHVDGNKVSICGRSGRDIDLLGLMDMPLIQLGSKFNCPVVFDGELVVVDEKGRILSRKVGNGIINKAIKGTISEEEAKMVRAQLWDVIPLSEFHAEVSTEIYEVRFNKLAVAIDSVTPTGADATFAKLRNDTLKFWLIPSRPVKSLEEAQEHFEEMLSMREEGTILKNMCGLWENTRSKHLVKFKAEKECDLEIIGWNPGKGKFVGQVGSLICASSDRKVEVSISGFSDDMRLQITKDIEEIMGGIAAVMYNERISSKDKNRLGVDSLFLPRMQEIRSDKTVADHSKDIK